MEYLWSILIYYGVFINFIIMEYLLILWSITMLSNVLQSIEIISNYCLIFGSIDL